MWYYIYKDGVKLDAIHAPQDKRPFESFDLHYLMEQLFTLPDESIQTFFTRVCSYSSSGAWATIDGAYYNVTYEED